MKSLNTIFSRKAACYLAPLALVTTLASAVEIHNSDKADAVYKVIRTQNMDKFQAMLNKGMDINTQFIGDGTPLIMAVAKNRVDFAKDLVAMGADVNQSSRGDGNPLIVAAMKNNLELASFLFENGAHIDAIVPGDETALINASRKGHFDMVRFLVENGADVNLGVMADTVRGQEYRSPLNMAMNKQVRDYLIAAGAQPK